ncbi:unnamed protein product [Ilex paraguariensis]|uniref:U-box domain-containing protein n=1 Tax=Ilex paraguariensis TaxID=185542 RepID=A0ABC8T0Y3_9AQUA
MEEEMVEALLFGDKEAQVLAARELGKSTSKQRHKLAERGVIAPLVSMLHAQDYEAIEAALFALLSLAFGSERFINHTQNKIRIAQSEAIPGLLKVLQCQTELFDLAIAALLILSSCTANKLAIAASGAIQLLVEILYSHYPDDNYNDNDNDNITISLQAKLDIISTLHNLSTCHQIIPSIVSSATVISLLQLINASEKSSELVEKAMALLEKIVSSSEIALKETAGTEGAIQLLVEAVEEGSPQCQEHAVGILLPICKSCRHRYRGMILREGAMPGLLQLSVDGARRAKEKAKALLQLLRDRSGCTTRGKQSKNALLEQGMRQIDRGERAGETLRLVEGMIAKLRT